MVNTNKYMAKFLFLHLLDFLKVLYFFPAFFLSCFLSFFLKSFIFFLMHWSSLRSLLRTYEWSTCRNPSIVFTDAKSATEKERRHLHISNNAPNLSPKILHKHYFQFLWDGYNIQEKWKTPWKVMQNWAGGGGGWANKVMIMGDVQVTNPAILTEQTWSIKDLFYDQIIVVLIHNSLSYCYLVFYE